MQELCPEESKLSYDVQMGRQYKTVLYTYKLYTLNSVSNYLQEEATSTAKM